MIRKGYYGTYKGKEYKINRDMEGNLLVFSHDPSTIEEGFIDTYNSGLYSKVISEEEITNSYRVKTKGKIKGRIVNISKENENEYFIGTPDSAIAEELGMDRTDKYYYDMWIPKDRVEVLEERENKAP
ncbi:hypothetical protein LRR81_09760 [Metabacillus sp. GX 13764]|uniref:hypothetical protein n=1 Tax=Metabacillus kandeliae TaxID=2900151 RepID=UPI001E484D0A|nr:hypothetical protein [Metabacillus kandeliae]MCD7034524.1 hypothetical protein [Metabacillus kandeliae]